MLASWFRPPKRRSTATEHSPFSTQRINRQDIEDETSLLFPRSARYDDEEYEDEQEDEDEDAIDDNNSEPLLPIFSSEVLDRLPIYSTTRATRLLVIQRCETTLSWDQLRSPQVSQFLVKPIQQQIRESHFSRGTLYALLANCFQFQKEGELNPGNIGVSRSRAMICQLLAVRLLKEYSTRELIDALFYDFNPMQDDVPANEAGQNDQRSKPVKRRTHFARISAVEIAIRAQAKKFLAHPLVVAQLEAVWAGGIVFHSAADSLHRKPTPQNTSRISAYGTMAEQRGAGQQSAPRPKQSAMPTSETPFVRRSVTLYDPSDASLFKLSRLRVPRYRQIFSTCSFAVMLGLFLAVLVEKSLDITALEVLFWFWSAGFLLDEVIGFTEQGFGLYIMSVWNAIDLGILLLFVIYYILRLYSIVNPGRRKHTIAKMAYDVLASTAVLLFPRLFSLLDHYRYFSQLLIAFRMMAMDLIAILILIMIACSGFFVAFTLSFSDQIPDAGSAAYALFQMLMGFTPAAWEIWDSYNPLGKAILTMFLIIAHFLIVTILITVLTNSFMAIVQNANEEHQFLFAVNTISMVKSESLFSYVAPTNVLGWLLTPFLHFMPFRQFVRLNRTLIKVTHFPILFTIFAYERVILSQRVYEPTDVVEMRGRSTSKVPAFSMRGGNDVFSPGPRLREPSVATFQKDRALEEVFRRPFKEGAEGGDNVSISRKANVVDDWMHGMGQQGGASPPLEQPRSVLDRLESRRPRLRRTATAQDPHGRRAARATARSIASDPENITPRRHDVRESIQEEEETEDISLNDPRNQADADDNDGDDELVTNDEDEGTKADSFKDGHHRPSAIRIASSDSENDYFGTPMAASRGPHPSSSYNSATRIGLPRTAEQDTAAATPAHPNRRRTHNRNLSTNTILYSPVKGSRSRSASPKKPPRTPGGPGPGQTKSGAATPAGGRRTPKRPKIPSDLQPLTTTNLASNAAGGTRPRPILPLSAGPRPISTPNIDALLQRTSLAQTRNRIPSFNARALDLASDIGDNRHGPDILALPASFSTQLEMAGFAALAAAQHRRHSLDDNDSSDNDFRGRFPPAPTPGRGAKPRGGAGAGGIEPSLLMARMGALEQGIREVVKEVKGLSRAGSSGHKKHSAAAAKHIHATASPLLGGNASSAGSAPASGIAGLPPSKRSSLIDTDDQKPSTSTSIPGQQKASSLGGATPATAVVGEPPAAGGKKKRAMMKSPRKTATAADGEGEDNLMNVEKESEYEKRDGGKDDEENQYQE